MQKVIALKSARNGMVLLHLGAHQLLYQMLGGAHALQEPGLWRWLPITSPPYQCSGKQEGSGKGVITNFNDLECSSMTECT